MMFNRIRLLVVFLLLFCPALNAAPNITVSGNSVSILGLAQTISLTCTLIDPNNTGNLRSGSNIITVFVTSTVTPGSVATCGPIYGNDVILDGFGNSNTTYYKVQVFTVSGGIIASTPALQQFYAFTGSGTIDLSTATPLAPSFMSGLAGSVVVPGNLTVNGTFTATLPGALTVNTLNKVIYVDQQAGATADVKATNCITALPSGGTCDGRGFGAGAQSWAAQVTVPGNISFVFDPATLFRPSTAALNLFKYEPGANIQGFTLDCTTQTGWSGTLFQNDTTASYVAQNTEISRFAINSSCSSATGTAVTLNSTSGTTGLSSVDVHDWSVTLGAGTCLNLQNSSTGFVNSNQFSNFRCNVGAGGTGILGNSGGTGVIESNQFSNYFFEGNSAANVTGIKCTISGSGIFNGNQFSNLSIWDTGGAGSKAIDTSASFSCQNNSFIGTLNGGTFSHIAGDFTNTLMDSRSATYTFGSFGGGGGVNITGALNANGNVTANIGQNILATYNSNNRLLIDGCISTVTSPKYANTSAGINSAIAAAIAAGGGIVDATACNTLPTYSSEIAVGNSSGVPVVLLLPNFGTWTATMTGGTSYGLRVFNKSAALSFGTGQGEPFTIQAGATSNLDSVCGPDPTNGQYTRIDGFACGAVSGAVTVNAIGHFAGAVDNSYFGHLTFSTLSSTASKVLWVHNSCCSARWELISAEGSTTTNAVPCTIGSTTDSLVGAEFKGLNCVHPGSGQNNIARIQRADVINVDGIYLEVAAASSDNTTPFIGVTVSGSETSFDNFTNILVNKDTAASTRYLFDFASGTRGSIKHATLGPVSANGVNNHNGGGSTFALAVGQSFDYSTEPSFFTSISSTTANRAASGFARLGHADAFNWRNNANSADIGFTLNSGDLLSWGGTGMLSLFYTSDNGVNTAGSGSLRLANTGHVAWRDSANATDHLLGEVQTQSVAGCTTSGGASAFTGPCTVTVTWPSAFADANYRVSCVGLGPFTAVPLLQGLTGAQIAASVTVQTQQATGVNAAFTTIHCIGIHQ